jgi:putrescine importer
VPLSSTYIVNETASKTGAAPSAEPQFRRVLTLWDLVIYGVVLIQPIAPVGIFGIAQKLSVGHVIDTIIVAMLAIMLTAFSYGRMAAVYPSAGSAYTYVSRGVNSHGGFLVGWAMFLDYLMIPLINTIFGSLTLHRLVPSVPYVFWVVLFTALILALNLRGVRAAAKTNTILLFIMTAVIGAFVVLALRFLFHTQGWSGVFSSQPFYDPKTFDAHAIATATSLAALTYIGFDGVTTLAEEVRNPKRTVPLATVLVCLITGVFSSVEVYLGQRVWPNYGTFPNLETAFMDVTRRVGGPLLFGAMGIILIVACVGSGLSGQVGAARLLYGMGRDNVLPKKFFGHLDRRSSNPTFNLYVIAAIGFAGALFISYEHVAELLNFGAFLAFMGVNVAAIRELYFRRAPGGRRNVLSGLVMPSLGFLFCLAIWWSLPLPAKAAGGAWFLIGLVYDAIKSRGFRHPPGNMDFAGA